MKLTSIINLDQTVPVSEARARLPKLIEKVKDVNFLVLVRKYQPKAALVDLSYFEKLITVYKEWEKYRSFSDLEKIRQKVPIYPEKEVEKDINYALKKVRRSS